MTIEFGTNACGMARSSDKLVDFMLVVKSVPVVELVIKI